MDHLGSSLRASREALVRGVAPLGKDTISLKFAGEWLTDNPLTVADLKRERQYLAGAGFRLYFGQAETGSGRGSQFIE